MISSQKLTNYDWQGHSKKVTETELLLFDLRGENERLETQVKSARDKAAGLEERLREMAEQADSAAESFHLQPPLSVFHLR